MTQLPQLELTIDDIKWAIVATKKLKVKQEVRLILDTYNQTRIYFHLKTITIIPRKHRLRIYVDGDDKYYRLRELKRGLEAVVVKVYWASSSSFQILTVK